MFNFTHIAVSMLAGVALLRPSTGYTHEISRTFDEFHKDKFNDEGNEDLNQRKQLELSRHGSQPFCNNFLA
jgi:hypothetical protein